jgi:hypothetical protein
MDEKESLAVIQKMIDTSKRNLSDNAVFYLLWGWLVIAAVVVEYILLMVMHVDWHAIVWPVFMGAGAAASIIIGMRSKSKSGHTTFIGKAMRVFWAGWLAFLLLLITSTIFGSNDWGRTYSLIIAFYGMGTVISGGILKFKPLVWGGVASFVLSLICIFSGLDSYFPNMLVAVAVSIIVSYLIPGYLLKKA